MKIIAEAKYLVHKDLLLEFRQKYALGGVILYVFSTVFLIYITLTQESALQNMEKKYWNILFWMTILFASVNAVAKSFTQENKERLLYYYTITSPQAIILSKMFYNAILMIALAIIALVIFLIMIGNPIKQIPMFIITLLLGGMGFSFVMTMISAIASKAGNNTTLMAVLSFPLILPLIMVLMKLSRISYIDIAKWQDAQNELTMILAINVLIITLSYILFPYLWKD